MTAVPPEVQAVGVVVFALAALIGMGAAAVGLFVLRVEHTEVLRRLRALEAERRGMDGQ